MNAKEYLLQIKKIRRRVNLLQAEVDRLRTDAESVSINLDGMPRGKGKSSWENLAIQLAECESILQEQLSALWSKQMEAILLLGKLKPKHQQILTEYYIADKTWERIAYEQDITWRHCYRLHGSALAELEGVLENERIMESDKRF